MHNSLILFSTALVWLGNIGVQVQTKFYELKVGNIGVQVQTKFYELKVLWEFVYYR